jgi:hypothetical protein
MATTTSVTTTYAGESSGKWISAALLSGVTLSNELITIMPNVKYKSVVSNLVSASGLADASCDFTATGAVTLTERILEPKSLQVNKQLCKADFRDTFQAIEMGYSAHDVLPKSFADYLLAHQAEQVAADIESHIWNGDANNSGEFNGFMTLLTTDAALPAAQEVAGTTLTAANIITEMGKVADAIPSRLYGKEGLRIYVSQNAMRLYVRSLGGFGTSGLGANGVDNKGTMWYQGGELMFDGIPVVVANGLTADQMLATTKENLFFGTGLLSDQNLVKLIDLADIDGSENCRLIMRMTAGVQYGNVTDIVTYGITNAVN